MVEWLLFCVGIAIIIGAGTLNRYVAARAQRGQASDRHQWERIEERLAQQERRLGDIQEVVLAIEEKLEHLETRRAKAQEG